MKRRSLILTLVIVGLVLIGGGALFYGMLNAEPELYVEMAVPPGDERQQYSHDFEKKAFDLFNEIQNEDDWHEEFTEHQVNSWLAEDFVESNLAKQLPSEISEPRVAFRPGKLFLAFRYGGADWNTVVSVEAKVWVTKREPNTIAVEIERLKAGALPLTPKFIQDELTEGARRHNIDVQWYRNEGNPVAVFRLQADRRDPGIQLQELELKQGAVYLKGRSLDPTLRGLPEFPFGFTKTAAK